MSTRINIKFKAGETTHIDWELLSSELGDFKLVTQTPPLRLFTVEVDDNEVEETLAYFSALDSVLRVNLDETVSIDYAGKTAIPLLDGVPDQWALPRMNVFEAHEYQKGDPNIIVAVIDTGLLETHDEFSGRGIVGHSIDDVTDPWNLPGHFHGTACASCISPLYDGANVTAVAPNVTLIPLRASVGTAGSFTYSNISMMITAAVGYGADIISYSIGGSSESVDINDAIDYALESGVLFVHSAGNSGRDGGLPSAPVRDDIISVGSIDKNDLRSDFSSYGSTVNIVAPGEDILAAGIEGISSYVVTSGTSFACPHVAAVAALIKSENPALTNDQIKEILYGESTKVSDPEFDTYFTKDGGIGCVNALKCVLKARSMKAGYELMSFAYFRIFGDNVTHGYLDEGGQGFFVSNIVPPVDAEIGVYGASEVAELFQGDNFVYRGPKFATQKLVACSDAAPITVERPV